MYTLNKTIPPRQVNGLVVDCDTRDPILGATVTVVDTINNVNVYSQVTGNNGTYAFTLPDYQPLKLTATAEGYYPSTIHFNMPADETALELTNPAICLVKIPEIPKDKMVLENVYFAFDKAVLLPVSFETLDKLVASLNAYPDVVLEIGGHTDDLGSEEYNQQLSQRRAQAVVDYLISKGIAAERLTAVGYGESRPIAPNRNPDGSDNPEGREKNRRTEAKVINN
jgi:outer membrane protein OmpA-like peptidoglycan-associated protein